MTRDQVRDLSRLRRVRDGRMLGGVSEGLSRHLDIDPLLIRVIFGALTVFGGAGIVLYVLAWLTIPEEGAYDSAASRALRQDPERTMAVGLALAGIAGAVTLLGAIGFATPRPWAVITLSLIALVLFAVFSRRSAGQPYPPAGTPTPYGPGPGTAPTQAPTQTPTQATAPMPAAAPAFAGTDVRPEDSLDDGTAATTPIPTVSPEQRDAETRAWWQRPDNRGPGGPGQTGGPVAGWQPPPPPPRPKSRLTPITLAVMALTLGGIWLADVAGADIHPSVYPGSVLALTAAALLLGTWYGRAKLLIPIGLISAFLTAALTVIGPGPYGERIYEPTTASAVKDTYHHGAGRLLVDLENVSDVNRLDGRTINIDSRVGLVQVVIPTSIDARVTGDVDGGDITGPTITTDDGNGAQEFVMDPRFDGRPLVTIDVSLKFGKIEILRVDCPQLAVAQQGDRVSQDLSTQIWNGGSHDPAACH